MNAPTIEYGELLPMLIVFQAAIIGVLIEAFVPRPPRHLLQVGLALVALIAAFVAVIWPRRHWSARRARPSTGRHCS